MGGFRCYVFFKFFLSRCLFVFTFAVLPPVESHCVFLCSERWPPIRGSDGTGNGRRGADGIETPDV
jgi:hypothetical protein